MDPNTFSLEVPTFKYCFSSIHLPSQVSKSLSLKLMTPYAVSKVEIETLVNKT